MQLAVSYSLNMSHSLLTLSEQQIQQIFFHWIYSLCKKPIMNIRPYPSIFILLHTLLSVQLSCSVVSKSLLPHGLQHARLPCPSPTPRACSHSCPLSWWCHSTISSSFVSFSPCLQSFPASGSFLRSQFYTSGGQIIGVSASASVLPMNKYSEPISFKMAGLDLLADLGTEESSPIPQSKSIYSLAISFLYGPILTSVHDYWKNHNFD